MKKDELVLEIERLRRHITKLEESSTDKDNLIQKTSLLASIVESSNDAIIGLTVSGTIVSWNKGAEKIFGYSPGEVVVSNIAILVLADGLEGLLKIFEKALSGQHVDHYEAVCLRKDGTPFPGVVSVSPIPSGTGSVIGILVIVRDITEQKMIEGELKASMDKQRKSEETFSAAINATNESLVMIDREGTVLLSNRVGAGRMGSSVEKILGTCLYDHFSPDVAAFRREEYNKVFETGEPEYFEDTRKGRNFEQFVYPVLNERGEVSRAVIFARDVTGRRQAEALLKQSEEKYRSIFENVVEGIYQTMPEGRFISVNPAMARIHGFSSPEEMLECIANIGEQLYVDAEDRKRYQAILQEQGAVRDFEARVYHRDGRIIWTSVNARAVRDAAGNILRFEGTAEDITDRKNYEEKLKTSAQRLRKNLAGTIQVISMMLETRDPYTAGHQKRVSKLARSIAQEMNVSSDITDIIRMAGSIHDIGKMSVPGDILSRPARLNDVEMQLMRIHPQTGYDILKVADLPHPMAEIVLQHHERLDGSGYPQGLKNDDILLEAQILSVADVIEAMVSHRPYRPALAINVALEEIEKNKTILYHPKVVEVCLRLFREKGFAFE